MKKELKWKLILIAVIIALSVWRAYPYNREKIRLGLDLQGGIHLLLEVQAEKAVESTTERFTTEIRNVLRREKVAFNSVQRGKEGQILIDMNSPAEAEKVDAAAREVADLRRAGPPVGNQVVYAMADSDIKRVKENAVSQGLETIRNRIDQFGVAEPTVQRQGERRIIVELPGVKDPQRAINLIGKTAVLEFKLVDEEASLEEALKSVPPIGDEILYQRVVDKATGKVTRNPYLLKKQTLLTGDFIKNAEVRIDPQFNQPYVSLTFDKTGARIFSQVTGENVKKRLAIILDDNVYSAPVIQEKISGGQAQITGLFTHEEARDLAIVLRAGSLPAPVNILENRTVGPSLGQDSINKGILATIFGGLLVVIFMAVYYKLSGLLADFALALNLILLLGAMAQLGATLTLPGIAGIALTLGMAVDANVLILERIREELRLGKTVRAAIDAGYSRAFLTIVDSNVTTVMAALILFQFGTGPVKGFALTLTIGIIVSMFTAIFVTRTIYDIILSKYRVVKLSI